MYGVKKLLKIIEFDPEINKDDTHQRHIAVCNGIYVKYSIQFTHNIRYFIVGVLTNGIL